MIITHMLNQHILLNQYLLLNQYILLILESALSADSKSAHSTDLLLPRLRLRQEKMFGKETKKETI